jgi:hypothetical protein
MERILHILFNLCRCSKEQEGLLRPRIPFKINRQHMSHRESIFVFNPLNVELNPICHLLALLGAHHILYVSRIRVKVTKRGGYRDHLFTAVKHISKIHYTIVIPSRNSYLFHRLPTRALITDGVQQNIMKQKTIKEVS